jgi:predicted ATPase
LVETVPLLIFGISRPERDTPAARLREFCALNFADHYIEIRLAPLSESYSDQLIDNLLDIENMPASLRELIIDKADGNPFFLEEVLRTLIDASAVLRDASSGRWRATAQIEALHIPNTIQGVIMARVDRLDEELKQVSVSSIAC